MSSQLSVIVQKIKVANPIVEMDGDEMTRIIWSKIRGEVFIFIAFKLRRLNRTSLRPSPRFHSFRSPSFPLPSSRPVICLISPMIYVIFILFIPFTCRIAVDLCPIEVTFPHALASPFLLVLPLFHPFYLSFSNNLFIILLFFISRFCSFLLFLPRFPLF